MGKTAVSPELFTSLGDLLKYLRRREGLTQRELAIQVGYSDTQISRIEQNQRVPDDAMLNAQFIPALHLEQEPGWAVRLLELARQTRTSVLPEDEAAEKTEVQTNLPSLLTTFIGREKELPEIIQLIGEHRLVTLTGPGGIGKTRLSIKVGSQILENYQNGVWFVELAALTNPDLLAQTVASVLGVATQSSTIPYTQMLINFLYGKLVLIILDNCEHILDACAQLTDLLLKNCSHVHILTTSRQPLGILGEVQYRLPALGLPNDHYEIGIIREFEAVRLFEERAKLAQPDFTFTPDNADSVVKICKVLDGIPLAIELAAARVNIFTTDQIAERLVDRLDLLKGGSRTALQRNQTIRASIDWSWNLISNDERILLRRLTVFSGGWTLEGAEFVCSTVGIEEAQISDLLSLLVAKSLVIPLRHRERDRRFFLHTTIKQYAHQKINEAGEQEYILSRHLKYFADLSSLAESGIEGPQQLVWIDRLFDERDNILAALNYAARADLEAGLFLIGRLLDFWRYYDFREGLRWTSKFIQNPEAKTFTHAYAKALLVHGNILWNLQQFEAARLAGEECLDLFRACGDIAGEYYTLMLLGGVTQFVEGMELKREYQSQALDIARSMGNSHMEGLALANLGWDQRDPLLGRKYWEESITLLRQAGDWRSLAVTLGILGFTLLSNGEIEIAQKYLEEAYELNQQIRNKEMEFVLTGKAILALMDWDFEQARRHLQKNAENLEGVGNRMGMLWARVRIGYVSLCEGKLEEAYLLLTDAVDNFHADQNKSGLAYAFDKLANIFALKDELNKAAKLIGWSDKARLDLGDPRPKIEQADVDCVITQIKERIGTDAFDHDYQAGAEMSNDEIVISAKVRSFSHDKTNQ